MLGLVFGLQKVGFVSGQDKVGSESGQERLGSGVGLGKTEFVQGKIDPLVGLGTAVTGVAQTQHQC